MKKLILVVFVTIVNCGLILAQLTGSGTVGSPYTGTLSIPLIWYPDIYTNRTIYAANITIASGGSLTISPGQYYGGHLQFTGSTTLTINTGGSFTINPQTSVSVFRIINNGTITLESFSNESGVASLLHRSYSGTGNTLTKIYLSGGSTQDGEYRWHYISVPIVNINATLFNTLNLAQYHEDLVLNEVNESGWVAYDGFQYYTETITGRTFSTLEIGKGYNYYKDASDTYTLSGNLNITEIEIPVTCGTGYPEYQGFNLLGNPYASCLDWDYIMTSYPPASVNNAIYFTNNGKVASYVGGVGVDGGTGTIPPLQGFFIHATSNSSVYIAPDARTHNLDQYRYKKGIDVGETKKDTISLLRLNLENTLDSSDLVVRFNSNATPLFDSKYDAYKFSKIAGDISIWTTIGNTDYSINGFPFPDSKVDIPVGIKVTRSGSFKLSANEIKRLDNYSITLKDLSTSATIDLKKGEEITFDAPAGITEDRFILSITNLTTDIPSLNAPERKFNIYSSNGSVNVLSLTDEFNSSQSTVTIYDLTGRKILRVNKLEWSGYGDVKQFAVNPAEYGFFIVEVTAGNKKYVEKVNFKK